MNRKTRATYYTTDKVNAARQNVLKYEWAKSMCETAEKAANRYVANGLDFLWESVP
ncbi:MAG: hypothetical protein K0R28_2971, partial [Paenibacillus sp.]|nr:hypothetical protein [Paenibacillus sp.]